MTTNFLNYAMQKTAAGAGAGAGAGRAKDWLDMAQQGTKTMASTIGLGTLAAFGTKAVIDKIKNDHNRKAVIEDLMQNDPVISQADKDEVLQYYISIYQHAPKLSRDKNVVRDLLHNALRFGRMDLQTLQTLIKTEKDLDSSSSTPQIGSLLK